MWSLVLHCTNHSTNITDIRKYVTLICSNTLLQGRLALLIISFELNVRLCVCIPKGMMCVTECMYLQRVWFATNHHSKLSRCITKLAFTHPGSACLSSTINTRISTCSLSVILCPHWPLHLTTCQQPGCTTSNMQEMTGGTRHWWRWIILVSNGRDTGTRSNLLRKLWLKSSTKYAGLKGLVEFLVN